MLAISSLYFVVTGIQYWMTDYLRNVLKQDKTLVFLTYSILSITAPTFGAIFGFFACLVLNYIEFPRRILCKLQRGV